MPSMESGAGDSRGFCFIKCSMRGLRPGQKFPDDEEAEFDEERTEKRTSMCARKRGS